MADDTQRPYRSGDPYGRVPRTSVPDQDTRGQGAYGQGDPLAELARLIGQNDAFAEFGRVTRSNDHASIPRRGSDAHDDGRSQQPDDRDPAYARDQGFPTGQDQHRQGYDDHGYDDRGHESDRAREHDPQSNYAPPYSGYDRADGVEAHQRADERQQYNERQYDEQEHEERRLGGDRRHDDHGYDDRRYDDNRYSGPHADDVPSSGFGNAAYEPDHGHSAQHAHDDPTGYAAQPQSDYQDGYHAEYQAPPPYGAPGQMPPRDEQFYEDTRSRRRGRGGLMTIAAVLGLAVLGVAGAFGYRAMFGTTRSSSEPPPVIKASTEPSKIVPPQQTADASSKLIYDRVGDRSQNERMVPREEQPVDIQAAPPPRSAFPSMAAPTISPVTSAAANTAPGGAANIPGSLNEPKRVHTVPIRPDQSMGLDPARPAAAGEPRSLSAMAAAASTEPPLGSTSRVAAPVRYPNAPTGGAPMSLSPDAVSAPTSRPSRSGSMNVASIPAASAGARGSYVQVSSQRSEGDAQSSFRALQAKYPNVLGNRQVVIRRADLGGKGVYYRAQVGPFASVDEAAQLCSSLKAAGGQCVVQRN